MFDRSVTSIDAPSRVDRTTLSAVTGIGGLLLAGELFILLRQGDIGLVVHTATIAVLVGLVYRFDGTVALLFQSLILLPILRIFNLGLPPFTDNPLVFLGTIYLFLLMSTWLIVRSQELSLEDIGLTLADARLLLPGAIIGLVFGVIQFLLALESFEYSLTPGNAVLVVITTGLLVGLVEELIFRGLVQRWADSLFGRWPAIGAVSVLFGSMHSVWLAPLDIVFAGSVSILIGWLYARTGNMWLITGFHGMINVAAFLLAPVYWSQLTGLVLSLPG